MFNIWPRFASIWPVKANDAEAPIRTQRLPPELWAIIIDVIIDEIRHPYQYCTPRTFSQFQKQLLYIGGAKEDPFLADWKSLRAVCRIWNRFAGPRPHLRILRAFPPEDRALREASSLFMEYYTDQAVIIQHLVQNPSPSSNLTTLIFSYIYPDRGNVIDVLLDNPSVFLNLRCLVFPNLDTNRPFWGRIQAGFPKLVALVIGHSRGIDDGYYTLQSLETLEMDSWFNFQLSCPALKHLSIRGYTSGVMDEFMRIHGNQLESLLLGDQGSPLLARGPQKFWSTFPNLELLGIYFRARNIRGPRLEHPLRHLRLFPFGESISPDDVLSMIESFRTVTHIYLAVQDLLQVGDIPRPADELRDRCRERGVEIVELRE